MQDKVSSMKRGKSKAPIFCTVLNSQVIGFLKSLERRILNSYTPTNQFNNFACTTHDLLNALLFPTLCVLALLEVSWIRCT